MIQMIRLCPDCSWDRRFEQHHTVAGNCPDSSDGLCPEWCCTGCGAALLISVLPAGLRTAGVPVLEGPVLAAPVPKALVA